MRKHVDSTEKALLQQPQHLLHNWIIDGRAAHLAQPLWAIAPCAIEEVGDVCRPDFLVGEVFAENAVNLPVALRGVDAEKAETRKDNGWAIERDDGSIHLTVWK